MQKPEVHTALLGQGLEPSQIPQDESAAMIRADIQKSKDVIRSAGIKAD